MRTVFFLLLLQALVLAGCSAGGGGACCMERGAMDESAGVYRHVVVFKFKPTTTQAQIEQIVADFGKLPEQIDGIIGYEHGVNVSPEGLDRGFTHVFLVTFKDKAGLEAYLPHPAHKRFVEKLLPLLEEPFVVDYVAERP